MKATENDSDLFIWKRCIGYYWVAPRIPKKNGLLNPGSGQEHEKLKNMQTTKITSQNRSSEDLQDVTSTSETAAGSAAL